MAMATSTAAIISLAMSAASAVAGSMAAAKQQKAQRAQLAYQAQVARNNQTLLERQAEGIEQRGKQDVVDVRRKGASVAANQTTAFAAAGVDIGFGSPLDIFADTAAFTEQDIQTAKFNTAQKAHEKRVQAANTGSQAGLFDVQRSSLNPGNTLATGLLTGAAKVGGQFATFKAQGTL